MHTKSCCWNLAVEINQLFGFWFLEFEVFANNQEDCRKKWLSTEEMCSTALKELNEARANREKLELQVRHVTELLKNEILIRQRLQKEEKDLVKKQTKKNNDV